MVSAVQTWSQQEYREQGGTFGYTEKHSDSTGHQRSPIALTLAACCLLRKLTGSVGVDLEERHRIRGQEFEKSDK